MIGLVRPDAGTVRFEDREVRPETAPAQRLRMGYVIQDGGLFPHLTAAENVLLMARQPGVGPRAAQDELDELAALTQFPADGLNRYPVQLSAGSASGSA
jgi:osmoprotectant transport system ATP-binding protein